MLFALFLTLGVALLSVALRSYQTSFAQKAGAPDRWTIDRDPAVVERERNMRSQLVRALTAGGRRGLSRGRHGVPRGDGRPRALR